MKKQLIILAILATIINSLAGCAGTDWRAVRRDAGAILGKVAVAQLRTLVAGNLGSDYGHAAAQAAWGAVDVGGKHRGGGAGVAPREQGDGD